MCLENRTTLSLQGRVVLRGYREPEEGLAQESVTVLCFHCALGGQMGNRNNSSLRTLFGATDVCGWASVDGALRVLRLGILTSPIKVVHPVLHEATDFFILKVAGVICGWEQ